MGDDSTEYHSINAFPSSSKMMNAAFVSPLTQGIAYGYYLDFLQTLELEFVSNQSIRYFTQIRDTHTSPSVNYEVQNYGSKNHITVSPAGIGGQKAYGCYNLIAGNYSASGADAKYKYGTYSDLQQSGTASYGFFANVRGATRNYAFYVQAGDSFFRDTEVDGDLTVTDALHLTPVANPSVTNTGTIFFDSDDSKLKVWNGSSWDSLN